MDKERYYAAKTQLVTFMQEGQSWKKAAENAGLLISQSNAYRLWGAFRQLGEIALKDGRHGHSHKLCGTARTFLERPIMGLASETPHGESGTPTLGKLKHKKFTPLEQMK